MEFVNQNNDVDEHVGLKPAKLEKLMKKLRNENLDTDMSNYTRLGYHAMLDKGYYVCPRLKKNVKLGVLKVVPTLLLKCKCSREIVYNCIIRHIHEKYIVVIGRCCYLGIAQREQRKEICSVDGCCQRHLNTKYSVCNEHKKEVIRQEQKAKREQAKEKKHREEMEKRERELREKKEQYEMRLREREMRKKQEFLDSLGNALFGFGRKFRETRIKDIPMWYVKWLQREEIHNSSTRRLIHYNCLADKID